MNVLYQVECKACGLEFFVPPAHQGVELCRCCESLKNELGPKVWELAKERQEREAFFKWLMVVVGVVCVIVLALVMAKPQ